VDQHVYSRLVKPAAKALARTHVAAYRATRGSLGARWAGGDVALITTIGRRSGRRRTTPVVCLRDNDHLAIVASNGGSDHPPSWWLNLQHNPRAEVEIAGTRHIMRAHRPEPDIEASLAARFCRAFPRFEYYQRRTKRNIPVVVLRAEHEQPHRPAIEHATRRWRVPSFVSGGSDVALA